MAVGGEGMIVRPEPVDDVHAGIVAVRMDRDQPSAGAERARERRDHFAAP